MTMEGSASGSSTRRSRSRVGEPHRSRGVDERADRCPARPLSRRPKDRQHAIEHEGDQRRARTDAADERQWQQEAKEREARNGLDDARQRAERPARAAAAAPRGYRAEHRSRVASERGQRDERARAGRTILASSAKCDCQKCRSLTPRPPSVPRRAFRAARARTGACSTSAARQGAQRRERPAVEHPDAIGERQAPRADRG